MKHYSFALFVCLFSILLSASRCKKNNNPDLPPATTTGAMTFGCKVNGKVFVPRDGRGRPGLYCQYVNLGEGEGGGWYLAIPAVDQVSEERETVRILTDSLFLAEGINYTFKRRVKGYANVEYDFGSKSYLISSSDSGNLFITKNDPIQRVLSGNFWFNATDQVSGEKVEVREGRFDIVY